MDPRDESPPGPADPARRPHAEDEAPTRALGPWLSHRGTGGRSPDRPPAAAPSGAAAGTTGKHGKEVGEH